MRNKLVNKLIKLIRRHVSIEALNDARKIELVEFRSQALASVVEAMAKAGMTEDAVKAASNIELPDYRSQALVTIVEMLAERHETADKARNAVEAAQKAAEQISNEDLRSAAFANVGTSLAKLHLYRQARELVDNISAKDKLAAYAAILREYYIELHPDQAKLFEKEKKEDQCSVSAMSAMKKRISPQSHTKKHEERVRKIKIVYTDSPSESSCFFVERFFVISPLN